jgi:hypothetical protein
MRDTTEMHAPKRPAPSDAAPRFGPFDGGTEGGITGQAKEKIRVDAPLEERITVRQLGAEDPKAYRHKGGSTAKTELGSAEFQKPQADVAKTSQPIPVEYLELLKK